jgi:hypothetical protein
VSFGKGGSQASTAPRITGLKIQTSVLGRVITLAYGVNRQAPWLLWYGDFTATQHAAASGGKGGGGKGGGGGGGKKGGGTGSYTYTTSVEFGVCYGPLQGPGIGAVFTGKMVLTPASEGLTIIPGTFPQSPWSHLVANHSFITQDNFIPINPPFTIAVGFNTGFQQDFGVTTPVAPDGTPGIAFTAVPSSPGVNQYSVSAGGVYTFNSANGGIEVLISYQSGTQNPGNQAIGYNGIALVAKANLNLGGSPTLPNINFETFALGSLAQAVEPRSVPSNAQLQVSRAISIDTSVNDQTGVTSRTTVVYFANDLSVAYAGGGALSRVSSAPSTGQYSVDANGVYTFGSGDIGAGVTITYQYYGDADPSFVVTDLLTNPRYGAGFPVARLDSSAMAVYQAYCQATGLLISPVYDQQATAQALLDEIAKVTNSAFVWASGKLKIVPFGDEAITGNGYTYTPPAAALFDLTDDDFLENQNATGTSSSTNTDPVLLIRKRPADQINSVKVEFANRNNMYNPEVVEAKDQAAIDLFTLRQAGASAQHLLTDPTAARLSAQLQLQRGLIRNVYQITLDLRYMVLDPMDIVTLTDAPLGLVRQWARIMEIVENDDGTFSMMLEEYLQGTGHSAQFSFGTSVGYAANYNQSPGNVNVPIIYEVPVQIAGNSGLEIACLVSGGANFGGCDIWASSDGSTYKVVGRAFGSNRQGFLTAPFPAGADPDTADVLAVNLTESNGSLQSGTRQDADLAHTLCWVDGEFVSYQQATLVSQNFYRLGSYLRRGFYNSPVTAHATGSQFGRIDGSETTFAYDKSLIGSTIYVKFLAFNTFGGAQQTLSDVQPYLHLIKGPPPPPNVTGFTAQQLGNAVVFGWNPIPLTVDSAIKGYDISYGVQGAPFSVATPLTESAKGTEMTNADVPAGPWRFWIVARDIADQLSPQPAYVDLTVSASSSVPLFSSEQDLAWVGVYQ